MLDIKFIRENSEKIKKAVLDKQIELDVDHLLKVDEKRRQLMQQLDNLRAQKNKAAELRDIETGKSLKAELEKAEEEFEKVDLEFVEMMVKVPNIVSTDTPVGQDEADNVEIEKWGVLPQFDFKPLTHIELAKKLDIIDFERGTKVAGYRGYYLKNEGVMLVMALMMYALNKMVAKGYTPMIPPTLVKGFALFGSGYFKGLDYDSSIDEIYKIASKDKNSQGNSAEDKFLVGTAEPSLLAYYSSETLSKNQLPIRMCGFSPCYRSEIGSYGKDTKGLYRVHEFFKVEQVVLTIDDLAQSDMFQQEMLDISKEIHQELGMPYRVLQICTGDMSPGKYKAFDIEAWMAGLSRYGETGSASNFTDWQSRRLDVKFTDEEGNKKHVYMLNNTALASPRPLIAILENNQKVDGTIIIPEVLRKYTGFSEIKPKG